MSKRKRKEGDSDLSKIGKIEKTPKKLSDYQRSNEATGDAEKDFFPQSPKSGRNLSEQFKPIKEGDIKPIEEGDMGPPSTATKEDYQKVVEHTRSKVQDELAELGKGRKLIKKVEDMPGIPSPSDTQMQKIIVEGKKPGQTPSETEGGGGFLEMFGLAGGRRRRRRKSRRKKRRKSRKSRRKRRKRTKKKRRRKSRRSRRRRR